MRGIPRPHRSHRTLAHEGHPLLRAAGSLIVGVLLTYLFLQYAWPILMSTMTDAANATGRMATPLNDTLLGISNRIPLPNMPTLNLSTALWVAGICLVILVVTSIVPGKHTPLRYWVAANAVVLMLSAIYAFFTERVAYDAGSFMFLLERTSLLMILCAPAFIAFVVALLPFTISEIALMLVLMVVSDAIFAAVRIAAFALIVSHFGAIAEMNIYMFFGPLLDVAYFMTVYSLVIVSLSKRVNRNGGAWKWL